MRHKCLIVLLLCVGCGSPETPKNNDVVVIVNNENNDNNANNANNENNDNNANNVGSNNANNVALIPADEFLTEMRRIHCEAAFACPSSSNATLVSNTARHGDVAGCMASLDVVYSEHHDFEASIDAGYIVYDGTKAADCLADTEEALCDGSYGHTVGGIASCIYVMLPQRSAGASCTAAGQCAEGTYCPTTNTECGERTCLPYLCGDEPCETSESYCDQTAMQCMPRKPEGSACNFGQCEPFTACNLLENGTCTPWGTIGEGDSCVLTSTCEPGLHCHPDERVCQRMVFGGTGAACGWRGAERCEPGLTCRIPEGSETGVCGAPYGEGESCRLDSACADGLICDVWSDDVCAPLRAAGDVCQSPWQCESRSCPGGMGSAADGVCEPVCTL